MAHHRRELLKASTAAAAAVGLAGSSAGIVPVPAPVTSPSGSAPSGSAPSGSAPVASDADDLTLRALDVVRFTTSDHRAACASGSRANAHSADGISAPHAARSMSRAKRSSSRHRSSAPLRNARPTLGSGAPVSGSGDSAIPDTTALATRGRLRSRRAQRHAGRTRDAVFVMERDSIARGVGQLRSHASPGVLLDEVEATRERACVCTSADVGVPVLVPRMMSHGVAFTSPGDAA